MWTRRPSGTPFTVESAAELSRDASLGQLRAETLEGWRALDERTAALDPKQVDIPVLQRPADCKRALGAGETAVFGGIGRQFMQDQCKARGRVGADGNARSLDDDRVLAGLPVGIENGLDQPGEFHVCPGAWGIRRGGLHELVRPRECAEPPAQGVGHVLGILGRAGRHGDHAVGNGEQVLHAMIELPREKLLCFFKGVPLGDVADDAIETDCAPCAALIRIKGLAVRAKPAEPSVRENGTVFAVVLAIGIRIGDGGNARLHVLDILGMDHRPGLLEGEAVQAVMGKAIEGAGALVPGDQVVLQIDLPGSEIGGFEREPVLALEHANGFLGPFLVMNVGACAEPARDVSGQILNRDRPAEEPLISSLGIPDPVFALIGLARVERAAPMLQHLGQIVGINGTLPAFSHGLPRAGVR